MSGQEFEYKKYTSSVVTSTLAEINKFALRKKILMILLGVFAGALSLIYVVSALYTETGSFTINVNKFEMTKYGLSLSDNREMNGATSVLNARVNHHMTNIAEEDIPLNVDQIDGEHNGKDYVAYTFYLKNAGDVDVAYEWRITMGGISNGIDEAIRLKLYVNGVPTVYAKTASDGSGAEPGTQEFYSSDVMALNRIDRFAIGEMTKFTVVLWLEGTDPDCLDWIIGGSMRLEMQMSIVH